jgi:hypothetical protein
VPSAEQFAELRRLTDERRHQELLEALARINLGLESLNAAADRQSQLLADISAKIEAALRYFVEA